MAVLTSDIVFYGCANHPNDATTVAIGGAIDTSKKIIFTRLTTTAYLEMISSNAGDTTQTVTIYGVDSVGNVVSEVKTLNGTTEVDFTTNWRRVKRMVVSGAHTGTITIRKNGAAGDIATLETGVLEVRTLHYNVASDPSTTKYFYDKFFIKNTNGTDSASSCVLKEVSDSPGIMTFDTGAVGGTETNGGGNNWEVAFAGKSYGSTDETIGNLAAGSAIEVFSKITLTAGLGVQDFDWGLEFHFQNA